MLLVLSLSSFFLLCFFFLMIRRPPRSTLFPYTTSSDLVGTAPVSRVSRWCRGIGRAVARGAGGRPGRGGQDRKSTRLNSSHTVISYAVFCLKKKKKKANAN